MPPGFGSPLLDTPLLDTRAVLSAICRPQWMCGIDRESLRKFLMTHSTNVLCLVSREPDSSVCLQYCRKLVDADGAVVHFMAVGDEKASVTEESLRHVVQDEFGETGIQSVVASVPNALEDAVGAIRTYVKERNVDLVIAESSRERSSVPPLSHRLLGRLLEQLSCPTLTLQAAESTDIHNIVVPTDLSDASYEALNVAVDLASEAGATISLVHVINQSPYIALTQVDRLSMGTRTLSEHRAHRQLERLVAEAPPGDAPIQTSLLFGSPGERITHFVDEVAPDLLVLSSHGRRTGSEHPLGPVAEHVLRHVRCPVYLVPISGQELGNARNGAEKSPEEPASGGDDRTDASE